MSGFFGGSGSVAVGSITGLGTGVATWLATPSSANLASAVTGETGTGAAVFGTNPTLAGFSWVRGADIASAGTLVPGADGNLFHVTGTTQINLIESSGKPNLIALIFDASLTVSHNAAPSGTQLAVLLPGAANFSATSNDTLILAHDGTSWFCLSRIVI